MSAGEIEELSEQQVIAELRAIISGLELTKTVFRANHRSNVVPLEARLPRDKDRLLQQLDNLLTTNLLDPETPTRGTIAPLL